MEPVTCNFTKIPGDCNEKRPLSPLWCSTPNKGLSTLYWELQPFPLVALPVSCKVRRPRVKWYASLSKSLNLPGPGFLICKLGSNPKGLLCGLKDLMHIVLIISSLYQLFPVSPPFGTWQDCTLGPSCGWLGRVTWPVLINEFWEEVCVTS